MPALLSAEAGWVKEGALAARLRSAARRRARQHRTLRSQAAARFSGCPQVYGELLSKENHQISYTAS